jgi:drug/metabolite transporter (DMT)-like permease
MLYLLLAVSCSLAIGVLFKIIGNQGLNLLAVLALNYFAAAVLSVTSSAVGQGSTDGLPVAMVVLGLCTGVLFVAGFALLGKATAKAGMSVALTVMRLSVVIPFAASWLFWGDEVGALRAAGLLLAAGAVPLVIRGHPSGEVSVSSHGEASLRGRRGSVLLALFLTAGVIDLAIKFFDERFGVLGDMRSEFAALVFGSAALASAGLFLAVPRPPHVRVGMLVPIGLLLGAFNYGSLEFFLVAVDRLPGTVAFPANHFSIVVGGAILGALFLGERLSRANVAGLCIGVVGLVLLSA